MKRTLSAFTFFILSAAATVFAQNIGKPTPAPPDTNPARKPVVPSVVTATKPGETVVTFEKYDAGKPVEKITEQGVTFALGAPLQRSQAVPRIMFFPHLNTDKIGILNAMSDEQAIPVQATFPNGASAVTLVLWGSTGCHALVEAHDKDGKLLDSASLAVVPARGDPADPIPSFELTVKGDHIAYILFGGARNGEFLAAEEVRFVPLPAAAAVPAPVK